MSSFVSTPLEVFGVRAVMDSPSMTTEPVVQVAYTKSCTRRPTLSKHLRITFSHSYTQRLALRTVNLHILERRRNCKAYNYFNCK